MLYVFILFILFKDLFVYFLIVFIRASLGLLILSFAMLNPMLISNSAFFISNIELLISRSFIEVFLFSFGCLFLSSETL